MMIVGNYRLERELARDATRTTYVAHHRVMPRTAVVHVMADVDATTEGYVALQLLREACLMAALHHAGVPTVFETGLVERRPWFAVEHVAGGALADVVSHGPIDRLQALILVRDLAEVLHHAHVRGVIHCGLRPEHVVLASRPHGVTLCVTDWSTARAHDASAMPYVPTLASWHFTAPELQHGERASDRADTYSLGVIAHQLLTGAPFARGEAPQLGNAAHELVALVAAMVADAPADRPSCAEVQGRAAQLVEATSLVPTMRIRKPRWTPDVYDRLAAHPIGRDAFAEGDDDDDDRA